MSEAEYFYNRRIELMPANALNAHVALGVIAEMQGEKFEAQQHFEAALHVWAEAEKDHLQSPTALLTNKALALLYLGQVEEALITLETALEQHQPTDTIDLSYYDLLAEASDPPQGLTEIRRLLEKAVEKDNA